MYGSVQSSRHMSLCDRVMMSHDLLLALLPPSRERSQVRGAERDRIEAMGDLQAGPGVISLPAVDEEAPAMPAGRVNGEA